VISWFLSDLHLTDSNERNSQTLLRFLLELNQNPRQHRLFLLGDIFDVWVSDGDAFASRFRPLVEQIVKLKKGGGEVYYFEGNHDFHVDVFWTKKFGIPVIEDGADFDLEGMKVRVEHGDFISDDENYLKYRAFVRTKPLEFLGHFLPGKFWQWFGTKQSAHSRKSTSQYTSQNAEKIRTQIRRYAERQYPQKKFDLLVTGHMHVFDDFMFASGGFPVRSINLGTWLEKPRVLKIESITDKPGDTRKSGRHVISVEIL
jgi:UDP-2,3-diacylglucosamine hydrolase